MFVKWKAIVFYFEYRARIASWKMIARHPRESGTGISASVARDGCIVVIQRIAPARIGLRTVPGAGTERVLPLKESRKRSFPRPRGGQDAFRGKALGGSSHSLSQVLRQGDGACRSAAKRVARLWAPPAPSGRASRGSAGGGFPGFADFTTWDRSAPASEHPARNIGFRSSSRRLFRDYLPGTKILPPSDPRGCYPIVFL